jgi:DNA-directed RNA polymerase specialized sigma subunit
MKMYNRIYSFVEDKKHINVNLEDLVKYSSESIEHLTNFLEIKPSKKQISKALSFVHPELIKI